MQLLHSSKCCCCADLRTGGIIIGILGVLEAIGGLTKGAGGIVGALIIGLISAALLYGIFAKKADFILPAAIYHIIILCVLAIFDVVFFIAIFAAKKWIIDNFLKDYADGTYYGAAFGALVLFILCTVLFWHFTSVLYSLWKNQKEGARPNAMYGA